MATSVIPETTHRPLRINTPAQSATSMTVVILLAILHAGVDMTSAATVYTEVRLLRYPFETILFFVILYNCLAFGLQFLAGWLADLKNGYRLTGFTGICLLSAAALIHLHLPYIAIVLVGLGNALFHVGAGAIVLRLSGGRSTENGIFVAPGAVGLVIGLWLGMQPIHWEIWLSLVLPLAGTWIFWKTGLPLRAYKPVPEVQSEKPSIYILIGIFLLMTIGMRSFVGGLAIAPWRSSQTILFLLAGIAMLGKGAGGIIADHFGWQKTAVLALAVCAPLLALGQSSILSSILGLFLFQFTMPITLTALYLLLPERPGLAFGLPCLALLLGALPALTGVGKPADPIFFLLMTILLSIVLLFKALSYFGRESEMSR
ncbi:MAG: MFS transporter [Acidobacteria bacterium]|nr:MFS transporter [Acidobacteriota bacterium]